MVKRKIIIIIFLAMLVVPSVLFWIIKDSIDTTNYENRVFATLPHFSIETLESFPKDFETYYNDHLPFKNQLKRINSAIEVDLLDYESPYVLSQGNYKVIKGKENWMYFMTTNPVDNSVSDFLGNNLYSEEVMAAYAERYQAVNDTFSSRGQTFVALIAPNKESVYPEYMPNDYGQITDESRTERAVKYINENTTAHVLYLEDLLKEYKEDYQVYYKHDTHWNHLGGFLGVLAVNNVLQGTDISLDDVEIVEHSDTQRDLSNMLSMTKKSTPDIEYEITSKTDMKVKTVAAHEDASYYHWTSDAKDTRSVLMIRDSFGISMMGFLPRYYGEVVVVNDIMHAKQLLQERHFDIILFETVERLNHRFQDEPAILVN